MTLQPIDVGILLGVLPKYLLGYLLLVLNLRLYVLMQEIPLENPRVGSSQQILWVTVRDVPDYGVDEAVDHNVG